MPVYDYECEACGPFTAHAPMAACDEAKACPACGGEAPRAFLTFPNMSGLSTARRNAFETNERSADSPQRASRMGRHAPGCACCSGGTAKKGTVMTPSGAKSFPAKRPWMISH